MPFYSVTCLRCLYIIHFLLYLSIYLSIYLFLYPSLSQFSFLPLFYCSPLLSLLSLFNPPPPPFPPCLADECHLLGEMHRFLDKSPGLIRSGFFLARHNPITQKGKESVTLNVQKGQNFAKYGTYEDQTVSARSVKPPEIFTVREVFCVHYVHAACSVSKRLLFLLVLN